MTNFYIRKEILDLRKMGVTYSEREYIIIHVHTSFLHTQQQHHTKLLFTLLIGIGFSTENYTTDTEDFMKLLPFHFNILRVTTEMLFFFAKGMKMKEMENTSSLYAYQHMLTLYFLPLVDLFKFMCIHNTHMSKVEG